MRHFVVALTFLTRVALPGQREFKAAEVGKAARWFPLVGGLIGFTGWLVLWALSPFLPALVLASLIVIVEAWLTGALHLDGLADMADGFGGGRSREEVLRIMRDHAIGSYGAVALIVVLLLKVATTAGLMDRGQAGPYLVIAPMLGRWSTVLLNCLLPYARRSEAEGTGPGGSVTEFVGWQELLVATMTSTLITLAFLHWRALACWPAVIAVSTLIGRICHRRIGGVTGDTLGASTEVCEAVVLLVGLGLG
jgi:cobalamin 5'-phosphate synthase/cobalamin synthase